MKQKLLFSLTFLPLFLCAQHIQWQQTLGGNREEHLFDAISTYDYGVLLAGSSVSEASGNKADGSVADLDYWLWKMTEDGALEWQKNFGGSDNDYLYSVSYTQDGGYILGGSSDSPAGHDKETDSFGKRDFWLLKLNPLGEMEWQRSYGGSEDDQLTAIRQTEDGGYWVAGTTSSGADGNKKSPAIGNTDIWLLRLDENGALLWERTLGGLGRDATKAMQLSEQGLWLVAHSHSGALHGQAQALLIDHEGNIKHDFFFGDSPTEPAGIALTKNGHLVIAGSQTLQSEDETQTPETDYWALAFDTEGVILHEERLDLGTQDRATRMAPLPDGQLVLSGFSIGKETLKEDYTLVSFSPTAKLHWKKQLQANADDRLQQVVATQDKGLLLAGTSNSIKAYDKTVTANGQLDYWILKTRGIKRYTGEDGFDQEDGDTLQDDKRQIAAFPIPAKRFVTVVVPFDFNEANLTVHDLSGRLLHQQPMNRRTEVLDMKHWPQGIFLLQVIADQHTMERKIVKDE